MQIRSTQVQIDYDRGIALFRKGKSQRGGEQALAHAPFAASDGPDLLLKMLTAIVGWNGIRHGFQSVF
jgi:hypothetical protein